MSPCQNTPADPPALQGPEAAPELARLHALCFPKAPWTETSCRETLRVPGTFLLSLPQGFLVLRESGGEAEILSLGVAPPARHHGLGHILMQALDHLAGQHGITTLFLEVSEANAAALTLYQRHGFKEIGRRKGYYTHQGNGEDAIVMNKCLFQK